MVLEQLQNKALQIRLDVLKYILLLKKFLGKGNIGNHTLL